MSFRIRVLGNIEICSGDRKSSPGSPKEALTLAALAWDSGRSVSMETMIQRVWDDPPSKPRTSLHTYISRIRRAMTKTAGEHAPQLYVRTHAYRLDAIPEAIDVHRYLSLTKQAEDLSGRGGFPDALATLDEAERLWRGDPLAGLPGTWAAGIREVLTEKLVAATTLRAHVLLHMGRFAETVSAVSPWAERRPDDEILAQHLLLALYGCGRLPEAHRVLQRIRHHLIRELGTEIGEPLRRIRQGMVDRVPVAELLMLGAAENTVTAAPAPASAPDNLPRDVALVGRSGPLRRLLRGLGQDHEDPPSAIALEAIDGMAGVGKTALAVHAAHRLRERFPDGRLLIDLRAHSATETPMHPDTALTELLRLMGVPAHRIPQDHEQLVAVWRTTMSGRRALIILDNAVGPEQVHPLLPGASPTLVIITSRRRLTSIPGVHPISLDALPPAEAVDLFQQRLGTRRFVNKRMAEEIVALCGYLPLAIEIAASRLLSRPAWSARDLAVRLMNDSNRLQEIRSGSSEVRRVFDVSYRALSPLLRMTFRRLGLHIGAEFGPHAVAALTGTTLDETERALEELLDVHLLQETSSHRFRLHDLLRDYARALSAEEPEAEAAEEIVQRLVEFYLYTADLADRGAYPYRARIDLGLSLSPSLLHLAQTWLGDSGHGQWFVTEAPNLLAILEYVENRGDSRTAALLSHVLTGFLDTEGYLALAQPHLRRAVAHWRGGADPGATSRALLDLSIVSTRRGDYTEASAAAEEALRTAERQSESDVQSEALHQLALAAHYTGNDRKSLALMRRAMVLRSGTPHSFQQARILNTMGIFLLNLDEYQDALAVFIDALSKFREAQDRRGQYRTLNNIAALQEKLGHFHKAQRTYEEAAEMALTIGSRGEYATLQMNLAGVLQKIGAIDRAITLYHEALSVHRDAGDRRRESISLNGLGYCLQLSGRAEESLAYHTSALDLAREIDAANEEVRALRGLGEAECRTDNYVDAAQHLDASLNLARRIQSPSEEAETLASLSFLQQKLGLSEEAVALRGEAEAIAARLKVPLSPPVLRPGRQDI
ncbi:tetratricopeptide repeat protein [Streptomyces sp. NPDC059853]|uniref:AfsR/SARP family transcriptional regulator n=1 Tax=Streptomyces sp. NPDC059853 TaxID=3346973 RepID=UPI00364C1D84